jgi:hypothetical protein
LGRGLGQLLEAHGVIRPDDGNAGEERPAAPIGLALGQGVRTLLLRPAAADPAKDPAESTATSPSPNMSVMESLDARCPTAAAGAVGMGAASVARATSAMLVGDGLLCLLAGLLLTHPATRGQWLMTVVGTLAVAAGAWLSCQAFVLWDAVKRRS